MTIPAHRPRGAALLALLAGLLLAGAVTAAEEEEETPIWRGFEPALMIGAGIHSQSLRGSGSADFAEIPAGRQTSLRFSFSEAELALFSPTLTENLGFRLFVHAGGQLPFTREHIASDSVQGYDTLFSPDQFDTQCPDYPPNQPTSVPSERYPAFANGSCEIRSRNTIIMNGNVFAGLGFDITLPIASRQFHIRPSLNWFAQNLRAESEATRNSVGDGVIITCRSNRQTWAGIPCWDATPNQNNVDVNDRYQPLFSQTDLITARSDTEWMHGLGPRLELNIEVAKVGNTIFEFFGQIGVYWLLTDRSLDYVGLGALGDGNCRQDLSENLQGVSTITNNMGVVSPLPNFCSPTQPGGQPISGSYENDVGPYVVQGGGGFRVVWRGLAL